MKRTLLTIGIAIISMCGCFGQKMPKLHNETIEASKEYQMGNAFQKDLLLYVDMLGKTHPYYADRKNLRKLDRDARKWYKECGKLTDTSDFRVFLETMVSSLNDGHTAVRYWDSFEKLFPFSIIVDGDSPAIINVTSEEQKEYLGKSVKSINGISVQDILKAARPYISADNQINYETLISQFFAFADFWKLLGMSSETLTVTTEDEAVIEIPAITRNEAKLAYLKETVQKKQTAGRRVLFEYEIFDGERLGCGSGLDIEQLRKLNFISIDHHKGNSLAAPAEWLEPEACSASFMVAKLLLSSGKSIPEDAATLLLTGIMTDTGNFCFANTDAEAFRVASELRKCGADTVKIANAIFFSKPLKQLHFEAELINSCFKMACNNRFAYCFVPEELMKKYDFNMAEDEGLIDLLRGIDGAVIAMLCHKRADGFRVSLRSKENRFPVGPIARELGGGGHDMAAGCTVDLPDFAAVEALLISKISALLG